MLYENISGIILSGGKSSRMGIDKGLLKFGDETIIERMTHLMSSLFKNVILITNTPSKYAFLNIPLYEDIIKHRGPLSGIHSGLFHSQTEKNFIISCDIPLMTKEMIKYIVDFNSNKQVKYCSAGGRHQYLAGVYSKSILHQIEKIFLGGRSSTAEKENLYSIDHLIKNVEAEVINPEDLSFYKYELFFNVNTPEDFEYLKSKII